VSSSSLLGVKIILTIEKYLAALGARPEFWRIFRSTECYHFEIDLLSFPRLYPLASPERVKMTIDLDHLLSQQRVVTI